MNPVKQVLAKNLSETPALMKMQIVYFELLSKFGGKDIKNLECREEIRILLRKRDASAIN